MVLTETGMPQVEEKDQRNKSGSESSMFASLAALGSVIVASSCCLPLLPFVFAAGAAGASAFVDKLRPYLLVASVLLIAFAFTNTGAPNNATASLAGLARFSYGFRQSSCSCSYFSPADCQPIGQHPGR